MKRHTAEALWWRTAAVIAAAVIMAACVPQVRVEEKAEEASARSTATLPPPTVEQVATQTQTVAPTGTATPTPTPTQAPTETPSPTPTVDAKTAAQIEWARTQVGDQLSDWIVTEEFSYDSYPHYRRFRINLIYEGVDEALAGTKITGLVDGKEQVIGEVMYGFKGKMLIGNEFKEVSFVWFYRDDLVGKVYRIGRGEISEIEIMMKPELAAERTGVSEMNAKPGRLVALFITEPGQAPVNKSTERITAAFWGANREEMEAFLETGVNTLGFVLPFGTIEEGYPAEQRMYPESYYPAGAPVIMPGYTP